MKNKLSLYLMLQSILSILGLSASAQQPKTAMEMNDYMTVIIDSVTSKEDQWSKVLDLDKDPVLHQDIALSRYRLEKEIKDDIDKLKNITDTGGSKEFREGVISYLYFEYDLSESVLYKFENINAYTTDEERRSLASELQDRSTEEAKKFNALMALQKDYANKNGLQLEPGAGGGN